MTARGHGPLDGSEVERRLSATESALGHTFADRSLLRRALTHPSYVEDDPTSTSYERLEFLGDAVLDLVVVEHLYRTFPDLPEGRLTKLKVSVVAGTSLARTARDLGLDSTVIFGSSELATGDRGLESALEDSLEALVGALYLDAGLAAAERFVLRVLGPRIDSPDARARLEHPKSALQELVQARGLAPTYEILAVSGPDHDRVFTVRVTVGDVSAEGTGRSKKLAEMEAAQAALELLDAPS